MKVKAHQRAKRNAAQAFASDPGLSAQAVRAAIAYAAELSHELDHLLKKTRTQTKADGLTREDIAAVVAEVRRHR